MQIKPYVIFFILFISVIAFSQYKQNVSNVATSAAPFLEIGVGSRAIGMGGAFVASANDASAMYWNPAGLGRLQSIEVIFIHTKWIADISFNYAGVVVPILGVGTIGANITTLDMGEMEVRTVDQQDGTGELFDASDIAIGVAIGFNLTDRFSIGLNAKYILQRIWKESSQGFAVDIGTLYNTVIEGLRIGAVISNFGTDMQMTGNDLLVYHDIDPYQSGNNERIFAELQTQHWPLPLNFQIGVAMDIINNDLHRITLETDAIHPIDNTESIHLGTEYAFHENYFLRVGYRNLFLQDSEEGLTLGGGINMPLFGDFHVTLDYAYADFGRLENAQRFSVNIIF